MVAPVDRAKIHVVRCGLDLQRFRYQPHRQQRERPLVVIVGRLSEIKGHALLIEAVDLLRRRGVLVDVEVIGGGETHRRARAADRRARPRHTGDARRTTAERGGRRSAGG